MRGLRLFHRHILRKASKDNIAALVRYRAVNPTSEARYHQEFLHHSKKESSDLLSSPRTGEARTMMPSGARQTLGSGARGATGSASAGFSPCAKRSTGEASGTQPNK
jgi:hypothetical protein